MATRATQHTSAHMSRRREDETDALVRLYSELRGVNPARARTRRNSRSRLAEARDAGLIAAAAYARVADAMRRYSAGRRDEEEAFLRAALGGLSRRQAARPIGVDRLDEEEEVQVVMDKEAERHIDGGVISDDDEDARPQAPLSRRRLKSRSCARQ
jgi:hypothetical protein